MKKKFGSVLAFFLVLTSLAFAQGAPAPAAPPAWKAPDPLALKDQEIRLLKAQLATARESADRERIGRIVYETQLRVAALHAFAVKDAVKYAPLTKAVLGGLFDTSAKTQYPGKSMELTVWFNQLFAALPEPYDMNRAMRELLDEQAAGVYDPHSKKLFVKNDFPLESAIGQIVLSHEICHAFQDQNFSLLKMGGEDPDNSDRAESVSAIAEGDATLLMGEFFAKYGNPLSFFSALPQMLNMDQEKLNQAPAAIQQALLFPYLEGMRFFQALHGRTRANPRSSEDFPESTWRKQIFLNPPSSTQQILHPELYLANKQPAQIEAPSLPISGRASVNVVGEFGIRTLLQPLLGTARSEKATEGWDGDRIALGESADGKRMARWITQWDTSEQADAFAREIEDALSARFEGKLNWQGAKEDRKATAAAPETKLELSRPTPDRVQLDASVKQGQPFPKVKTQPAPKIPGLF